MAALLLAFSLSALAVNEQSANGLPQEGLPRILSINLCADQLIMLLAEPQQILALSSLSREASGSYFHQKAKHYPQAEPLAEDILPLAPDIVLTGPYTSRYTLSLLDELGIRVESLSIANSIEAMLNNVVLVGSLLNQQERANTIREQALSRQEYIRQRVSELEKESTRVPRAVVYDANGYTVGDETLRGEAMKLAGWHNVALDKGIASYGVIALEELIRMKPDALIESPYSAETYSRGQWLTHHPALRSAGLDPLIIKIPSSQTICAGPWTLDVIEKLLDARSGL